MCADVAEKPFVGNPFDQAVLATARAARRLRQLRSGRQLG